jgi:biopolymer transport protein TolQ
MFANSIPLIGMIIQAGTFARIILAVLFLFSIFSWTIIIAKYFQYHKLKKQQKIFYLHYQNYDTLIEWISQIGASGNGSLERLAIAAASEHQRIADESSVLSGENREFYFSTQFSILQSAMEQAVARESVHLDQGVTFLAITTSVAPFIGLLGTVWGITHSFYEIGNMGSTSINIVAPGIAEALITTILGLVVAIPSAAFYSLFTKKMQHAETQFIDIASRLIANIKSKILSA